MSNDNNHTFLNREGSTVGHGLENRILEKMGGSETIKKSFVDQGSKKVMVHSRGRSQPEVLVKKKKNTVVWAWPWHGIAYGDAENNAVTETSTGIYPTRGVSPASVHPRHSVLLTAVPDGFEPELIPEPVDAPDGSVWVNYATVSNGILFGEDVGLGSWIWTDNDVAYLVKSTINGTTSVTLEIHLLSEWVAGMSSAAAVDFVEYDSDDYQSPYMVKDKPSGATRTPVVTLTASLPALVGGTPGVLKVLHGDCSYNGSKSIFAYSVGMPDINVAGSDKWAHGIGPGAPNFEFNNFPGMTETHHAAQQWVQLTLSKVTEITATFAVLDRTGASYREGQFLIRTLAFSYKDNELSRIFCKFRGNMVGNPTVAYSEGHVFIDQPYAEDPAEEVSIRFSGRTVEPNTFNMTCNFYSLTTVNAYSIGNEGGDSPPVNTASDDYLEYFADSTTLTYEPVWHHEAAPITPVRTRSTLSGSDEYALVGIIQYDRAVTATWDVGMVAESTPGKYRRNMVARIDGYGLVTFCSSGSKLETTAPWSPPAAVGPNDYRVPYTLTPCVHISPYGSFVINPPMDYFKNLTISFSPTDISTGTPQPGVVIGVPLDAETAKPKRFV